MTNKLNDQYVNDLFDAILTLKSPEECQKFFSDLCTIQELASLSQRYQVAKMLSAHNVYADIVNETGASTATISRVNRSINYGNGGYDIVFDRLGIKEEK